jgi:predicted phosphate transport protein (TIGR00153 family)
MSGFLQWLMPQEGDFFELFRKQSENIVSGAAAFTRMLEHYTGVPEQVQAIKAIEHAGDEITHQIFRKLNQTFITPFDREDIHQLGGTMDDVIDLIDAAASRFVLYRIDKVRAGTVDLSKVLTVATMELSAAIHNIPSREKALQRVIEINRLENESDRICRTLIAQLFEDEKDPVQIIKWKEIFEVLETAVDKCEDVSNVIESVILKNA